ncbi:hypothetical protein NMG60_11002077 [Bertholletia excelsa]
MASKERVAVFIDTNLGTHIAIDVSPDITAGDFKRDLEQAHLNCFPKLGEIRVNGLMVKQKSTFYRLPDSFPVKHAFLNFRRTWVIQMEAYPLSGSNNLILSRYLDSETRDLKSHGTGDTHPLEPQNCAPSSRKNNLNCKAKKKGVKRIPCSKIVLQVILGATCLKRKKRRGLKEKQFEGSSSEDKELIVPKIEGQYREEWNSCATVENPSEETLSETVSISGIIRKYFSDYEEVTCCSDIASRANKSQQGELVDARANLPHFAVKTPPRMLIFPLPTDQGPRTSRDTFKKAQVGKRMVVASNMLRTSASKQKSSSGLCKSNDHKSSSLVQSIVFEISDSED